MPIQYYYNEPDDVLCVKIKVPVVIAEEEVQVIVDNIIILPELAQKIDHIDARLQDFEARPIFVHENGNRWISIIEEEGWEKFGWPWNEHRQPVVKKVLVSGTLHKQIFYVDKNDRVKHVGEDIPFAEEVTLVVAQPVVHENDVYVQLHQKKIDMRWDLERNSRLQQTGVMIFQVKVVEERQIFVQVCPQLNEICPRGVNIIRDGSLQFWGNNTSPIFWGASNVLQEGSAALMGAIPSEPAALFQIIDREFPNVSPNCQYRLCFDAKEIPGYQKAHGGVASYSLIAELSFLDAYGNVLVNETNSWNASQISDDRFSNYCMNAVSPEETREALVRFSFEPLNPLGGGTRKCLPPKCKPPVPPPCEPPVPPPYLPPVPPPYVPPHKPPHVPPPCEPPAPPPAPVNTSAIIIDNVTLVCVRELET